MAVLNSKQAVVVDAPINIVELDPIASELVVLGLKRRLKGDPVKARDALQAFAAKAAGSDEFWYQLAQAEQRLVREGADEKVKAAAAAASETAVDRALAINPNHVRANVLKGRLQFEKLQAERDDRPTSWSKARAYVAKANAAANLDPEPLAAWYDSFAYQGKEPTKNASSGLELAFSLAPEVPDLRIKLAFDLARQGRFDEAIRLAEPLAFDPHDSEMGRTVLKTLKEMRGNAAEAKGEPLEPGKAQPSETKPASH